MTLIPSSYTPHSYVDTVVSDPAQTVYPFSGKHFLNLSHLKVYGLSASATSVWLDLTALCTYSGVSGSGSITLGVSVPARAAGDTVRIKRVTPDTKAGRLVDFAPGSLSEVDLDTSALQNLYIAQEVRDEMMLRIGRDFGGERKWDFKSASGTAAGAPSLSNDVARYGDIASIALAAGYLPVVTTGQNGQMLSVVSGAWAATTPADIRTTLALGTAALQNIGVGASDVLSAAMAATLYMAGANNLSEVTSTATARTNLGLGTAAILDSGVGPEQLVKLNVDARIPAVDGRLIDLSASTTIPAAGRCMAIAAINIGDVAQAFTNVYSKVDVPVSGLLYQQHNADSDITIDTAADTFSLRNGAANYWVTVELTIHNTSTISAVSFKWQLNKDAVSVYESTELNIPLSVTASNSSTKSVRRTFLVSVIGAGGSVFDISLKKGAVTAGNLVVIDSQIIAVRIGD